ncbi:uncharacterized protein [Aristolochia californica]|uniref:uncharacterized protein n=1 Tax=Aristolochia californica TaxID=171875 RepID=UPI0035DA2E44
MADVHNDDQRKRRLPLWMLGVTAADKIRNSGSYDDNANTSKESSSQGDFSNGQPLAGRHDKRPNCEEEAADMDQNFLVRCKTRKKAKKSSRRDLEPDNPEANTGLHQKKSKRKREEVAHSLEELEDTINVKKNIRKSHRFDRSGEIDSSCLSDISEEDAEPIHRRPEGLSCDEDLEVSMDSQVTSKTRKRKTKSGGVTKVTRVKKSVVRTRRNTCQKQTVRKKQIAESSEEIEGSSLGQGSEDEVDLTVDDLMSIAQEYVTADKEKESTNAALEELEPKSTYKKTSNTSTYESRCSIQATGSISGVSTCSMMEPTTNVAEKLKERATGKSILANVNRTGNPKVDMLDVFLGPLWNKSSADESELDKISNNITFPQESDEPIGSQVLVNGKMPSPVMKKKSSLKDKVAMYFDS